MDAHRRPHVLVVGFPDAAVADLAGRLPDAVVEAAAAPDARAAADGRIPGLLVVADGPDDPLTWCAEVRRARPDLRLIYCVGWERAVALGAPALRDAGVTRLLFRPVDVAGLAREAATLLATRLVEPRAPVEAPAPSLVEGMREIWEGALPQMRERVGLLIDVAADAVEGQLGEDRRAEAARAAHGIAGSGGTFGFPALSAAAKRAEEALAPGPWDRDRVVALAEHALAVQRELDDARWPDEPDAPADGAPPGALPADAPTILAVDDDPVVLRILEPLLADAGLRMVGLDEPLRALSAIDAVAPDLLVLDVDMPLLSGFEICRLVRRDPRFADMPVLVLSAHTDAEVVRRIYAAGADDYVGKPLVGPELVTRVTNRLERVRLVREHADTDPLTRLASRAAGLAALDALLARVREAGRPAAVGLLDLDRFRTADARLGREGADRVLRDLADQVAAATGPDDVAARWGGEELLVAFDGLDAGQAVARLTQVLERFRDGQEAAPEQVITFTAGVAAAPRDGGSAEELLAAAAAVLGRAKDAGRNRVAAAGMAGGSGAHVDVAVVDDDDLLVQLVGHALDARGLRWRRIADGSEAVVLLAGPNPAVVPRVVLLDVDLPGLSGRDVLRQVARTGVLADVRVIMLTAHSGEHAVVEALDGGAFDFVAKPFSVPELMGRVLRALRS